MRGMMLVARRELAAYFNSYWGWVVIAVILLIDGLLPWHLRGGDVGWNLFGSHERFFDGDRDVLGFDEVWELGGALRFPVIARLPAIELAGGALFGPDVRGWTLGLSVSF